MRSLFAGIVAIAIASSACFPHNAKHRRVAKISEGVTLATGIVLNVVAANRACMDRRPGTTVEKCDDGYMDDIGVGLILAGLVGFAATTISGHNFDEPDIEPTPEPVNIVVATPLSFCSAIYASNIVQAEAALNSYVRSQGVLRSFDAMVVLHAWLSRQACVRVTSDIEISTNLIEIVVPERPQEQYSVDTTDPARIFLHVGMHTEI